MSPIIIFVLFVMSCLRDAWIETSEGFPDSEIELYHGSGPLNRPKNHSGLGNSLMSFPRLVGSLSARTAVDRVWLPSYTHLFMPDMAYSARYRFERTGGIGTRFRSNTCR